MPSSAAQLIGAAWEESEVHPHALCRRARVARLRAHLDEQIARWSDWAARPHGAEPDGGAPRLSLESLTWARRRLLQGSLRGGAHSGASRGSRQPVNGPAKARRPVAARATIALPCGCSRESNRVLSR